MLEGPCGPRQEILMRIKKAGLKVEDLDKKKKVEGKSRRVAQRMALWLMEMEGITLEELKNFKRSDIVYPKPWPKNYYKDRLLPSLKKRQEETKKQEEEINKQEKESSKKREEIIKKLEEKYPQKTLKKYDSSSSSSDSSDSEDEDDFDIEHYSYYEEKMRDGVPNKRPRHVLDDPDYDEMSAIFKILDEVEAKLAGRRHRYAPTPPLATTSAAAGDDGMKQKVFDAAAAAAGDCTKIVELWLSRKRCV